jgi:hypothetical protein
MGGPAKVSPNPISIRQAVNFAWPTFKQHYGLFTAILLTIVGAWVALEIVVIAGQRFGIVWWVVAHVAFFILFAGIEVGFLRICLALYDGGKPTFADTFRHLALGPKFLASQVLYLLMVVVGLALLVVPGVYLGVRYALVGVCMAAGEANLIRSFQRSAVLSRGTTTYLLAILVTLVVLNVLGASLLGLGLFITVPLSVLTMVAVYRQLSTRSQVDRVIITSS